MILAHRAAARRLAAGTDAGAPPRLRPPSTLGGFAIIALLALANLQGCTNESDGKDNGAAASTISAADLEAALNAAEEYLASREYTKAETILEKLVERKPAMVEAWELLGQVQYSRSLEAQAQRRAGEADALRRAAYHSYLQATDLQPNSAGLQHSAGIIALNTGGDDAALEHFAAAGRLDPRNVQHPLYEAQVLIRQGRLDEAEAALERAHAIDIDEPFTISSMAVVAMQREDYERAVELIEEARVIDPRSLGLRVLEARIRRRAGEVRAAIDLLQPLPGDERAQEGVVAELAACYEAVGDYERAATTWTHRLDNAPNDWRAALRAAEAHARAGNKIAAASLYETARRIAPNEQDVKSFGERLAGIIGPDEAPVPK